jgi:S1-C subfamily serine protease
VIVDKVVPALIADGEYQHPFLGITGTTLTPDLAQAMDLPADQRGALLLNVSPDSPAAEAGLQPSERQVEIDGTAVSVGGDVITAIEGTEVRSTDDLITYLARHGEVGEPVTLEVLRAGDEVAVTATLAARPRSTTTGSADAQPPSGAGAWLGILGADMTAEAAAQLGLDPNQDGVYVAEVVPEGPAAQAGLATEDVIIALNEIDVSGMNELISLLTGYEPGDEVSVTVLRGNETMTFSVTLGEQAR